MQTSAKVLLVNEKALFEHLNWLLVVFLFLMNDSEIVIGIDVCHRLLKSSLIALHGIVNKVFLFQDSAHRDQSIRNVFIYSQGTSKVLLCFIECWGLSDKYFSKLSEDISVVRIKTKTLFEVLDSLYSLSVSNIDPAKTEVSPWRTLVQFNSSLEVFSGTFKILVLLKAFTHFKVCLKVVRICSCS